VEDFWRLYKAIRAPSTLTKGSNYHLFKHGITPEWEDIQNEEGGKWLFAFSRTDTRVDAAWIETLLAVIGEQLTDENEQEEICGIVIAPRKGDTKLALWTRHAADDTVTKNIGTTWRKILNLKEIEKLQYQEHDEALQRQTSFRNPPKYIV